MEAFFLVEKALAVDTFDFEDHHFQNQEYLCAAAGAADDNAVLFADAGVDVQGGTVRAGVDRTDAEGLAGAGEGVEVRLDFGCFFFRADDDVGFADALFWLFGLFPP